MLDDMLSSNPVGPSGTSIHDVAVANSLGWADEAAECLDFADALGWLAAVEAGGELLPAAYIQKQAMWMRLG